MMLSKNAIKIRKSHQIKIPLIDPDDVGLCNCASCRCELLGERTRLLLDDGVIRTHAALPPDVGGRIMDRPYCVPCLAVNKSPAGDNASWWSEPSPWQENAVRELEDGR